MSLRQGSCAWAVLRMCSQQVGSEGYRQQRKELGKGFCLELESVISLIPRALWSMNRLSWSPLGQGGGLYPISPLSFSY